MKFEIQTSQAFGQLPAVAGGWGEKRYEISGETFDLTVPAVPDALLDTPETLEAHQADGYMPYWGYLWPTSLEMCKAILERKWTPDLPTLELGTGVAWSESPPYEPAGCRNDRLRSVVGPIGASQRGKERLPPGERSTPWIGGILPMRGIR